jgi:hypothetical protein
MKERYWEDYDRYRRLLIDNVGEVERVCEYVLESERPDLFCVDFMSSDTIGHLACTSATPSTRPRPVPSSRPYRRVYDAVDGPSAG